MIPRIHPRGANVGGLLKYLFGPGRCTEHVNPHLIAAWHGAGNLATLQPPRNPDGRHDIKPLANLLEQPVRAARRPPAKWVWHCSVRNHDSDRTLTDQQWAHIAGEIMAAAGLAPYGDPGAVRWVAVRHSENHIHLVATLVRQDGRTAKAHNDYLKVRAAANDLEIRYGLHRVAPADRTTHTRPGAAELNKAQRLQRGMGQHSQRTGTRETPRDQLRREVRAAAVAADSEPDFFDQLRKAGLLVRLRESHHTPGQITGYAVARPGHHTADGEPVWYGGGRLAPDLTLPKLRRRWSAGTTSQRSDARQQADTNAEQRTRAFRQAAEHARRAADHLRRLTNAGHHGAATATAQAAADLLTATARTAEGRRGGPLTDATEAFDRAARLPAGRPPPRYRQADALRAMSRLIAAAGRLTGDRDTAAALFLIYHLAALAENLADLREAQQRYHQARDARHTATQLRNLARPGPRGGQPTAPQPRPTVGPASAVRPAMRVSSSGPSPGAG